MCSSFPQNLHSSSALGHVSWVRGKHFVSVRLNPLGLECIYAYASYVLAYFFHGDDYSLRFKRAVHALFSLNYTIVTSTPHIISSIRAFRNSPYIADLQVFIVLIVCHNDSLPFLVSFFHMKRHQRFEVLAIDTVPSGKRSGPPDSFGRRRRKPPPQPPPSMQKRHRPLAMARDPIQIFLGPGHGVATVF